MARAAAFGAGLVVAFLLLEISLRLVGGVFTWQQERRNRAALQQPGAFRIMCVGESTTAMGGEHAYPSQLQRILNDRDLGVRFEVTNPSIPGADTSIILANMENLLERHRPRVVVAMMGANDNHSGFGGGAVPHDGTPLADKTGLWRRVRTLRLVELLWFYLDKQRRTDGGVAIPRITRWQETEVCGAGRRCNGPHGDDVCAELGRARELLRRGQSKEAERVLAGTVRRYPKSAVARLKLGVLQLNLGRYADALTEFEVASQVDPGCDTALVERALFSVRHLDPPRLSEGAALIERARTIAPNNYEAYLAWADLLIGERQHDRAVAALKRAMGIAPRRFEAYQLLGVAHLDAGRPARATEALEQALARYPNKAAVHPVLVELVDAYVRTGQDQRLKALLAARIKQHPEAEALHGLMGLLHRRRGDAAEARRYFARQRALLDQFYCPMTRRNYRKLKRLTDARGMRLVVQQYPRRSVAPLKRLFRDTEGIIFVENLRPIEEALKTAPYEALFNDACYGDFGHATPKGNRIIAQNLADAIVQNLFNR